MAEGPLVSDPWLSADNIATHLGVTRDAVYAWIAEKGMPAHKVGRLWTFQASEVDEWVRSGVWLRRVKELLLVMSEQKGEPVAEDGPFDLPRTGRTDR